MIEVVISIVTKENQVLVVRRAKKEGDLRWQFPGGTIEEGETIEAATIRELKEETGIDGEFIKIIGDRIHPYTKKHIVYIACKYLGGTFAINDSDLDKVEWVDISALKVYFTTQLYEPVEEYLLDALNKNIIKK
ncbi:MAG: NUDIX domain-containing protein [Bacilli bacterium]|nr:NUDIX domain-containing protein [Bacilli bacterium]